MVRKRFDSLDESLQGSKDETEKRKAEAAAGVRELNTGEMESVSGRTQSEPPEWVMKDE